ncbi:MAG: type III secretion system export apparatus subunit SctS [Acidiferrobacterales bacterium]|nr:type III secretion system export apparatus subunit SctS [Acidiferrobacterales bacterium]
MTDIFYLFKTSLMLVIMLSAIPLIAAIILGVLISLVQTLFQVQDQTLPFAVKLVVVATVLASSGSWIGSEILQLSSAVFQSIAQLEP